MVAVAHGATRLGPQYSLVLPILAVVFHDFLFENQRRYCQPSQETSPSFKFPPCLLHLSIWTPAQVLRYIVEVQFEFCHICIRQQTLQTQCSGFKDFLKSIFLAYTFYVKFSILASVLNIKIKVAQKNLVKCRIK